MAGQGEGDAGSEATPGEQGTPGGDAGGQGGEGGQGGDADLFAAFKTHGDGAGVDDSGQGDKGKPGDKGEPGDKGKAGDKGKGGPPARDPYTPEGGYMKGKYTSDADLEAAHAALQTEYGKITSVAKKTLGAPEKGYDMTLPPEFGQVVSPDSPFLGEVTEVLKGHNINQEVFGKLLTAFARDRVGQVREAQTRDLAVIREFALGLKQSPAALMSDLEDFYSTNLNAAQFEFFKQTCSPLALGAEAVKFWHQFREVLKTRRLPGTLPGTGDEELTLEKLEAMQGMPEYKTDPAFRQRVTDGYLKLEADGKLPES